jgi:hypothetical protein
MTDSNPKAGVIEVRLRDTAQLFNSMDPSPFQERDLDKTAEEFIVGWAKDFHAGAPIHIRVHLAEAAFPEEAQTYVADGIRNYFRYRREVTRRRFSHLMAQGRLSLLIGLVFLGVCVGGAELLTARFQGALAGIAAGGLAIAGWVAMWRPMEIFLYDWWPLRREYRLYERLARAHVKVILPKTK